MRDSESEIRSNQLILGLKEEMLNTFHRLQVRGLMMSSGVEFMDWEILKGCGRTELLVV